MSEKPPYPIETTFPADVATQPDLIPVAMPIRTASKRLFFDIETEANPLIADLMPEVKAPGNYKDADTIEKYKSEKQEQRLKDAPLDPDYGRIIAIAYRTHPSLPIEAWLVGDETVDESTLVHATITESDLIELFWKKYAECEGRVVGFNVLNFDIPYIMRRSMALGIRPRHIPNLARFRTEPITDLFSILYNWSIQNVKGLKALAKLYNLDNPLPELDGSMIADMTNDVRRQYVSNDVYLTTQLYQRMNGVYFNHF